MVPQTVGSGAANPAIGDVAPASATSTAAPVVPVATQAVAPIKCNWTEHTSPDGYKYYYNSTTGESKVIFLYRLHFLLRSPHAIFLKIKQNVDKFVLMSTCSGKSQRS